MMMERVLISKSDEETLEIGREVGRGLDGGELILLRGGLGVGKTLFTKGVLDGLGFDYDEVTSPSFALVNLYPTEMFDVYHIDLWRLEGPNPDKAVGLDEILSDEKAVVIIEWSERLRTFPSGRKIIQIEISGDGDDERKFEFSEMLRGR
jgi:tRNA threonylcarbamoyladenosine biosynthesis protein TsaE